MRVSRTTVSRAVACALTLLVVACGETPHVQQAASTPLTEASVPLRQTGNAPVSIAAGSVSYRLDDARLLQVTLIVHSTARTAQTVSVRGSFADKAGRLIADASGSQLNVAPGSDTQVTLSGPTPNGSIAAATFEITTIPSATPLS
jgi:hypothetical protein